MNALKTTSKVLLVVAALSLTAVGCDRRADTSGGTGAAGTSSSGAGSMGSSGSGAAGGSGTTGSSGTGSK
ncbi:hypothetical protein [Noviherbaspirillum saxi]|uniref:hypothetical protein n=1 Tax=Noviherbaspirillum saxi TaxID=2320863 RepID=UPI0011C37171|nr:hypothetical protein [Noviherbaspirillum saxi]